MSGSADGAVRGGGGGGVRLWNRVALASALVICGALGLASYAKLVSPDKGKRFFGSSDILQDQVIAVLEIGVIVALLLGHRLRLAWVGVMLMFGGFLGYAAYYMLRGESCGCFGGLIELPPWGTVVMDSVIVLVAGGLLLGRGVGAGRVGAAGLAAGGLGVAGWFFADATRPLTPEEIEQREMELERDPGGGGGDVEGSGAEGSGEGAGGDEPVRGDGAGGGGPAGAGDASLPGRADGFTAMERLLRTALLSRARASADDPLAPAWYVFVYDPSCEVCQEKLIDVEAFSGQWGGGHPLLRVASFRKLELEEEVGIQYGAWDGSPVVFVVSRGRVVHVTRGEEAVSPQAVVREMEETGSPAVNFPGEG